MMTPVWTSYVDNDRGFADRDRADPTRGTDRVDVPTEPITVDSRETRRIRSPMDHVRSESTVEIRMEGRRS
ncbi:hypothetical protein ACERIT_02510 [Halopenitus sp. H-Gu1]|uniref:hypothetical protein n=1 Tax=Halopenitus sp. H-Gu1 TaxID=3242697 RepID=UPI00359DCE9E